MVDLNKMNFLLKNGNFIQSFLYKTAKNNVLDRVHCVLSAYSSMSKCDKAEEIIRQNLCRPFMQQTLEDQSISNLPKELFL